MNLRALQQFTDEILSYKKETTIWLDTDTGTYGGTAGLLIIRTTEWSNDDHDAFECMTDSERNEYGIEYSTYNGRCPNPLEYQRETGSDNQ